jgi:2-polyprenyl-6-methoxyphenol hydroxylase-like FAD-dependent oxidoreductase
MSTRVGIVGGGIGGLAAALALTDVGADVTVFERTADRHGVQAGTGLTLWTNGVAALERLGVGAAVAAVGRPLDHFENLTGDGRHLATWPVGELSRSIGPPNLSILRGDLHDVLLRAVTERSGARVVFGRRCTGVSVGAGAGSAEVAFADGATERFGIVVGADGVRSSVRAALGARRPPRYAGYPVWRGLADVGEDVVPAGVHRQLWGAGARIGFYRVGPGAGRVYWWATTGAPEASLRPGDPQLPALGGRFAGWRAPVGALLAATAEDDVLLTRVFHAPRIRRWGSGRATLLGDAAHAMTFNVGQGACQALEDAVVLGATLAPALAEVRRGADAAGIEAALRRYEHERRARTTPLVNRARRIGALGLWRRRAACAVRDGMLRVLLNGPAVARHCDDLSFQPLPTQR